MFLAPTGAYSYYFLWWMIFYTDRVCLGCYYVLMHVPPVEFIYVTIAIIILVWAPCMYLRVVVSHQAFLRWMGYFDDDDDEQVMCNARGVAK